MAKKQQKKNKNSLEIKILMGVLITIFAVGLLVIWVQHGEPWKISSYKEMKEVTAENFSTKDGEYFVFVYNKIEDSTDTYQKKVCEYANYARIHKNAPNIYFLDFSEPGNSAIRSSFKNSSSNVTRLIHIKDNVVEKEDVTWATIFNELENAK